MAHAERPTQVVQTDTTRITTITEGAGPPILILPSVGRDGLEDYDPLAARLVAANFRVLRPQPRGVAGSAGPMHGVTLHHLAADVAAVIDQLAGGRATLFGHAFGHFLARMTAVDFPAKVRGVVLAAAGGSRIPPDIASAPERAANPALPRADRLKALEQAFFAPGHDATPWLEGWYPATLSMQHDALHGQGVKQSDWWSAGTSPLLELIAADDPFKSKPLWGELREQFGPRVTTVVIENASHALVPEQPDAVADAVIAWLRDLPL